MGSSVKDAHLHIENEDSKTEKPGIWSASFAFALSALCGARRLLMRYVAVTPVRLNGPACWHALRERSSQPAGLTHPQRARRPHMMSMKADGPRNDCGAYVAQADFVRTAVGKATRRGPQPSQRATLTGRVAPESPMLTAEGGCIALYDVWRVWLYGCIGCMCCIRCIS